MEKSNQKNTFNIRGYLKKKKDFYNDLLIFLEEANPELYEESFLKFPHFNKLDKQEFMHFLRLLSNISNNYHRTNDFIHKIEIILQHIKKDILKNKISNTELFNLFKGNKLVILSLIEKGILIVNEPIAQLILNTRELNGIQFCHFFLPEIREFIPTARIDQIETEIPVSSDKFKEIRKIGENDSYICELIRHDSVEEFIAYINVNKLSCDSIIEPSIFETNSFLLEHNPTLIEYAAFFGSIQIFNYLNMYLANLSPLLWLYTIHSDNPEIIHILEDSKVPFPNDSNVPKDSYLQCFLESIKCHNNKFGDYFRDNFLDDTIDEKCAEYSINYSNYYYFTTNINKILDNNYYFFYFCKNDYNKIVDFIIEKKKKEIEDKIISIFYLFDKVQLIIFF